jgi:hypothetical protein
MGLLEIRARCANVPRHTIFAVPLGALLLFMGCSVINDTTITQCKSNDDCALRFGSDIGVSCVDTFCVQPVCTSDEQCRQRGDRYASSVCGINGYCTTAAAAGAACTTAADCNSLSPTIACVDGTCEDKIWGCVGQPDERPPITQATATLQGNVIDLSTRKPVPALSASACLLPTFDPECTRPLPGTLASYDVDAGLLSLTGVPQDTQVRVKIEFPGDSGLVPLDQYSARTAHDVTKLPTLVTIPSALSPGLTALLDPPRIRDPANASITAAVVNCLGEAAVGVQIRVPEADRIDGTEVFYFGEDAQIAPAATSTQAFGSALIINVKPGKLVTLQTWAGDLMLNQYRVIGYPRRSTAVHFFPRTYPDRTAGGT